MYRQLKLFQCLEEECRRYKALINNIQRKQECLPEGSLLVKNGFYYRAVQEQGKQEQLFISSRLPDQEQLLQELREHQYIKRALPVLRKNLSCCEKMLKQMQLYDPIKLRADMPKQYEELNLEGFFLRGDICPEAWASELYEKNTVFPEKRIHWSEGGLATRSKAEADIATMLERKELLFRYEPVLHFEQKAVSPDFCIVHPFNRKLVYWEHFGKMDDPDYAEETMDKLRRYAENGYFLGDNLIMTWESKANPLTFQHINERIRTYFFSHEAPDGYGGRSLLLFS